MIISQLLSDKRAYLMGIAMLSIMLFHQSWIVDRNPFFSFFHIYGNWGVDLFFFVSGFGLYYSLKKNNCIISFYCRRIIRILPLCIAFGIFRYIVDHILPVGKGGYPTGVHEISTDWITLLSLDKWFISVIIIYYMLMPLIYYSIERYGKHILLLLYLLWGAFFLMGILNITPLSFFYSYVMRFPSFCIGAIVAAGCVQFTNFYIICGLLPVVLALVYKFLMMAGYMEDGSKYDSFNFLFLSFGIVSVCTLIAKTLSICEDNVIGNFFLRGLKYIGIHSLELYLVHEFVYRYTYRFLIGTQVPLFIQMIIGIIASFLIAALISWIVGRIVNSLVVLKFL